MFAYWIFVVIEYTRGEGGISQKYSFLISLTLFHDKLMLAVLDSSRLIDTLVENLINSIFQIVAVHIICQ